MTTDIPDSPLKQNGTEHRACLPLATLALCNNDHAYDAALGTRCPQCGSYDRLMIGTALSPKILGPRIIEAVAQEYAEAQARFQNLEITNLVITDRRTKE